MALVIIENEAFLEITRVELLRVPCVGEQITFNYADNEGGGETRTVKYVTWDITRANINKPIARITVPTEEGDEEFSKYMNSTDSELEQEV